MIRRDEVYKIGILNKPHGVKGELLFTFTDDIFDRVEADYIVCLMDGILVPFYIEEYRFRQARRFTNVAVYFPVHHARQAEMDGELTWSYFVGFRMEEVHYGHLGEVTDVDTSTVNTLFIIDHNGEELLIPAQEEFITDIDHEHRVITVNLPEGLLNIDNVEEA